MSNESVSDPCQSTLVASSPLGSVCVCRGCGSVQFTLQHLTLRLTPTAFRELTGLAVLARQQMEAGALRRRGTASVELPASTATH